MRIVGPNETKRTLHPLLPPYALAGSSPQSDYCARFVPATADPKKPVLRGVLDAWVSFARLEEAPPPNPKNPVPTADEVLAIVVLPNALGPAAAAAVIIFPTVPGGISVCDELNGSGKVW